MRTLSLAWVHFRIGAQNELQYRTNFFIHLVNSLVALGTGIVAIALVFSFTTELSGWSRGELLAVMGIHIALGGLIATWIQPNMEQLLEDIREGNFDHQLVRPADAMLLVSIRKVQIWRTLDLFIGAGVLAYAAFDISGQIGWAQAWAFLITVLLGGVMIYCIYLMVTTWAFRVIAMSEIMELFQGVYQAGRWPVTLYPIWLRSSLTYIVPLAFAITVPAEALTGKTSWVIVLGASAFAVGLFALTRWVWNFNMKTYSGASA